MNVSERFLCFPAVSSYTGHEISKQTKQGLTLHSQHLISSFKPLCLAFSQKGHNLLLTGFCLRMYSQLWTHTHSIILLKCILLVYRCLCVRVRDAVCVSTVGPSSPADHPGENQSPVEFFSQTHAARCSLGLLKHFLLF